MFLHHCSGGIKTSCLSWRHEDVMGQKWKVKSQHSSTQSSWFGLAVLYHWAMETGQPPALTSLTPGNLLAFAIRTLLGVDWKIFFELMLGSFSHFKFNHLASASVGMATRFPQYKVLRKQSARTSLTNLSGHNSIQQDQTGNKVESHHSRYPVDCVQWNSLRRESQQS